MYANIVFLQGDEAATLIDKVINGKHAEVMEYLKQWDMGGDSEHDVCKEKPWGKVDAVYTVGKYTMSWNYDMEYIGLCREL